MISMPTPAVDGSSHPLNSGVQQLTASGELNDDNLDVIRQSLETDDQNYTQVEKDCVYCV